MKFNELIFFLFGVSAFWLGHSLLKYDDTQVFGASVMLVVILAVIGFCKMEGSL